MILKYLAMYMKILTRSLSSILAKVIQCNDTFNSSLCKYVKPGILSCNNEVIIALYKVKDWSLSIHDLAQLDYVYNLRKFLEILQVENCRQILLTDIEIIDSDKYFKKIDHDLQTRLIELSVDKTNVKLRNYIEKILETRKKILIGIKPVKTLSIVALVCPNTINLRDLEKVPSNAKNILNLSLEPVVEDKLALTLLNFRAEKFA